MHKVTWDIQYLSPPPVIKYCKKCGKKTEHVPSGLFRINAQRKYLDIWLIYKCSACDSTWNMTIYSRTNPKSIASEILDGFHGNDEELARRYAMDTELIRKNRAEVGPPKYKIVGNVFDINKPVELHIKSAYSSRLKISTLLREKLNLSQSVFERMVEEESIRSTNGADLKKCRLQTRAVLIIDKWSNKSEVNSA